MTCNCNWGSRGSPLDLAAYAVLWLLIKIEALFLGRDQQQQQHSQPHQAPRRVIDRGELRAVRVPNIPPSRISRGAETCINRAVERITKETTR